ncbi:MAG: hypothetical protein JWM12_2400, partial [Ilumatobacteraceae bacterium]|nr:hypothetical protein [Ilumatobacteraceae bacterium]
SGATTTITGGLPGTTTTVAGAPFIPPASTAPGATTAPGPVTLAPPVAPTSSSTTTGASTATTDPLGSTTLAPILAIEPPARPGPPVTETTTTTTASVLPPTTEPATTVADPAQYGGTLSLRRSGTSTRTVTVAATARDGLPDDTVMTLTFSSVDPQWSVTFTSIDRCVGLPAALSGDDAHSYTVQCVIPALAASATSSVAFVVDDPSHDGDDNDAVRARVTGQRPGGSAATQCDGPGC